MRQKFDFVGPNITPKAEVRATHALALAQRQENTFHKEELEKTPGERAAIELFDKFLKQEFLELDIPEVPELRPDRFHVMSEAWFSKHRNKSTQGSYVHLYDKTLISRERPGSPVQVYTTILHEAIHSVAKLKIRLSGEEAIPTIYRLGYDIKNTSDTDNAHAHLVGFNEGVVELTTQDIFEKREKEIAARLNLSKREMEEAKFYYADGRAVTRSLCHGLGEATGVGPKVAWDKIKRGQFTGEMMHLRDIERTYGKGSLRILDALDVTSDLSTAQTIEQEKISRRNEQIRAYFESYDRPGQSLAVTRSRLAIAILGLEGYKQYCQ